MCFAPQRRAIFEHRNFKKRRKSVVFCTFWLTNVLRAPAACHFWTSELQKVARECGVLRILTYTCTSRHSGVQFLRIETSKIGPTVRCFVHFELKMCFVPQWRAIFWTSERTKLVRACGVCLANVLRATAACNFSSVCWTATSAPAALARLLFGHQEARIIEKTQRFATSLTFRARVPAFYWLYTRVDLLSADLTSLLCLTPLLCFSTLQIVGS